MRRGFRILTTMATLALGVAVAAVPASAATKALAANDYCAGQCNDIVPPGENGNATLAEILAHKVVGSRPAHAADQLGKYASLASGYRALTSDKISQFFNDSSFGVPAGQVESTTTPRSDVTITRDKATGVPHIQGTTRSGTEFGAGYAAAQDRLWLMDVMRHVGRGQLSPFAGGAPGNRELEQQFFAAAPYTEQELQQQVDKMAASGPRGAQGLADAQAYVDGINKYISESYSGRYFPGEYVLTGHIDSITNAGSIEPFKLTDLAVLASVVGAQFGAGGGGEVQNAVAKLAIQERYGVAQGEKVWQSLRSEDDPEAVKTLHDGQTFPYGRTPANPQGQALPDKGSVTGQQIVFDPAGSARSAQAAATPVNTQTSATTADGKANLEAARGMFNNGVLPDNLLTEKHGMSNALVVSGSKTASGHPVSVFGPQTGYFAPQLLMLQELQGPGISARGASFAGLSFYILLGRGQDYAWSATSAAQDIIDTYRESKQWPQATATAREAVQKLPNDREVRMVLDAQLADTGEVDKALADVRSMLAGKPEDREIYITLAQMNTRLKRWSDAEEALNKAESLSTSSEDKEYVYFLRGSTYEREKKYDEAEGEFKKVLSIHPQSAVVLNYLGYMNADRGVRLDESLNYIKQAVTLDPGNGAYLDSLGWAYFRLGKYDLAEENLTRASSHMGKDPTVQEHLGDLYQKTGRLKLAAAHWERAIEEWSKTVAPEVDSESLTKVQQKLDAAKVRIAKEESEKR